MPKLIGSPVIETIQTQRENARIHVDISYNTVGVPSFIFTAYGVTVQRDASGNLLASGQLTGIGSPIADGSIPAQVHALFVQICTYLDTQ